MSTILGAESIKLWDAYFKVIDPEGWTIGLDLIKTFCMMCIVIGGVVVHLVSGLEDVFGQWHWELSRSYMMN